MSASILTPNLEGNTTCLCLALRSKPVQHEWPYQQLGCHSIHFKCTGGCKLPHPAKYALIKWRYHQEKYGNTRNKHVDTQLQISLALHEQVLLTDECSIRELTCMSNPKPLIEYKEFNIVFTTHISPSFFIHFLVLCVLRKLPRQRDHSSFVLANTAFH